MQQLHHHQQQQQQQNYSCYVGKMRSKICGVCGDKAKSYHFGGISCDSCKAFFRRSVQNEAHKNFHCPYDSRCHISMSSRKCCQFCRFRKCVAIGMEKSWVMSEQERMRLHTLRLQKKMAQDRKRNYSSASTQDPLPSATFIHQHLNFQEVNFMSTITSIYQSIMSRENENNKLYPPEIGSFIDTVQKLIEFAKCIPEFQSITPNDKIKLLQNCLYEMCAVVHSVDINSCCHLPTTANSDGGSSPSLSSCSSSYSSTCESSDDEWRPELRINSNINSAVFPKSINLRHFKDDYRLFVMFLLIILFNPDSDGLIDRSLITGIQDRFCDLSRRYLEWKVGPTKSAIYFGAILCLLPELCEIKQKQTETLTKDCNIEDVFLFMKNPLDNVVCNRFNMMSMKDY